VATSGSVSVWATWHEVQTQRAPTGSLPVIAGDVRRAAKIDLMARRHRRCAHYGRADLGLSVSKVTIAVGYEVLGGSPEDGQFRTPLATLHKFNGWADKFLNTPTNGLEDLFLSVTAGLGKWKFMAIYHDFSADTGGANWGTEINAVVIYNTPWKQQVALKFAAYDAKDWATDTTKLWIWTSWGF